MTKPTELPEITYSDGRSGPIQRALVTALERGGDAEASTKIDSLSSTFGSPDVRRAINNLMHEEYRTRLQRLLS